MKLGKESVVHKQFIIFKFDKVCVCTCKEKEKIRKKKRKKHVAADQLVQGPFFAFIQFNSAKLLRSTR